MFNRKPTTRPPLLSEDPSVPDGIFNDPKGEFAEIYGGAKVAEQRMFLVALVALGLAVLLAIGYLKNRPAEIPIPWLVEVNQAQGVVSRPVRVEAVKPSDAVIKAELARWVSKIFTIDRQLTQKLFGEANAMTKGLGTDQFTEFRVKQAIVERMNKDASLQRKANVNSVDVSQPGVAFIFLTTQESQGSSANTGTASYRVTLKYEILPPSTEAEILVNPLGLYITSLNVTEEGASR